jgi:ssDNA-binding replication factor A large subunit
LENSAANAGAAGTANANAATALIEKIVQTGVSQTELAARIRKKRDEFAGLLSEESAVKIIARECGVEIKDEETPVEFSHLSSLTSVGERANVFVRVKNVFAPKEFEKEKRKGRVCNVSIADETGTATLVLWNQDVDLAEGGKIERNDLLEIAGANVRTAVPLELHSALVTRITPLKEGSLEGAQIARALRIPRAEVALKKLADVSTGDLEFDAYARVLKIGEEKEFSKQDGKKGKVASCLVSDGSKQLRLVLWDKNADLARRAKVGDAVKIESGYCKAGREGDCEIHAGWKGHIVLHPANHNLPEKEKIWQETYPRKLLSEIEDGKECIASARLAEIYEGKTILKCKACNATIPKPVQAMQASQNALAEGTEPQPETRLEQLENAGGLLETKTQDSTPNATGPQPETIVCPSCGSVDYRELLILNAELDDGTATVRTAFFGKTALELLGIPTLTVDVSTVLSLKKEFLLGENLLLVIAGKRNPSSGALEATARHIISRTPTAKDDAEFVKARL